MSWPSSPIQHVLANSSGAKTSQPVTLGSAATAGNLVVVAMGALNVVGPGTYTIADSGGNAWSTSEPTYATNGTGAFYYIVFFYSQITTGGALAITVTCNEATSSYMNVSASEWAIGGASFNLDGGSPSVVLTASTATPSTAAITLKGGTTYPDLVIGMALQTNQTAVTFGAGSGFTQMDSAPFIAGTQQGCSAQYATNVTTSTVVPAWSNSGAAACQVASISFAFGAPSTPAESTYFMTWFGGLGGALNLLTAGSNDGANFFPLVCNYTTHSAHPVRDPSTPLKIGNTFFVFHTNGSDTATSSIDVCSSTDLINWTYVTSIDFAAVVGSAGQQAVVGPQWIISGGEIYLFVAGSPTYFSDGYDAGFIYWVQPIDTAGLTTWGSPNTLTYTGSGSGATTQPVDPYPIAYSGGNYLAWGTNQGSYYGSASSIVGAYAQVGSVLWGDITGPQGMGFAQSPSIIQLANGTWRWYIDPQGSGECYADCTTGPFGTYGTVNQMATIVPGIVTQGVSVINRSGGSSGQGGLGAALLMGA